MIEIGPNLTEVIEILAIAAVVLRLLRSIVPCCRASHLATKRFLEGQDPQ